MLVPLSRLVLLFVELTVIFQPFALLSIYLSLFQNSDFNIGELRVKKHHWRSSRILLISIKTGIIILSTTQRSQLRDVIGGYSFFKGSVKVLCF